MYWSGDCQMVGTEIEWLKPKELDKTNLNN